jgi:hypothetical protein
VARERCLFRIRAISLATLHACGWLGLAPALYSADPSPLNPQDFLARYCLDCHDADAQKGDRRLDDLPLEFGEDLTLAERWQEVMHQLALGEMPPAKKPRPTDAERRALLAWIEEQLAAAETAAKTRGGSVVHRRLNRAEYLHTIQDLFGFAGDFDPTSNFPGDEELEGFRNIGSVLRTSRHHLEQYLLAADTVLDHAYDLAEVNGPRVTRQWRDSADQPFRLNPAFGLGFVSEEKANGPSYIHLSHGLRNPDLIYDSKLFPSQLGERGVPHSGWYEIEVRASAANRNHRYGEDLMNGGPGKFFKDLKAYYDHTRPMQLGIGRQEAGLQGNGWRLIPPNIVHRTELPDDRDTTVRARVWLDRSATPYLAWIDGPPKGTRSQFISTKLHKYDPSVPQIAKHVWSNLTLRAERDQLYQHLYQGPEIRVRQWSITGPLPQEQPHQARALLFGSIAPEETEIAPARLRAALRTLASHLFRRDVRGKDIAPFVSAVQTRLDGKTPYAEAARPAFKALLCSTEFLFLTEPESADPVITPMQFVTRLSYFLTAGPPDDELRALAAQGSLDAGAIRQQTDRLLDSPRGDRFLRLFTGQWLGLTKLGTMAPDKESFPAYHIDRLEPAMKEETWRFFAELARTNQPVTALVDARFTYLNAGLAKLYELPAVSGDTLQRVSLPGDSPRRGLLGHASILTVSANGVETSPVTRGVWLLEKLFGTPPSPPPPDVPPIEPDIRGATTIRQQLEKHRNVQACADCHAKIDPLGYALEAYDPIGQFRDTYPNGAAIDTSGEYRGQPVQGPADIRDYLARHPDLLAHNLAHRLLTYALGRPLGFADQPALRSLLRKWKGQNYRLRHLIHLAAASELMRRP